MFMGFHVGKYTIPMDASWVMFHQQKKHSNPADAQCIHRSRRPQLNPNTDYWLIIRKIPKDRIYMDIRIYDAIQATQKSLRVNLINQPTNQPTYLPTYQPTSLFLLTALFFCTFQVAWWNSTSSHLCQKVFGHRWVVSQRLLASRGKSERNGWSQRKILKEKSGWWLNQPIWKICSSNWIVSPSWKGFLHKKYLSCHHLEIVCTKFHAQTISTLTMVTRSRGVSIWLFILLLTRNFMRLANCNKIIIPIYGSISIGSFQTSQITTPTNIKLCQNPPTQRSLQRGVVSLSVGQHALSLGPNTKHHPADGNPHWAFAKPKNVEICNKPATFHGITI